MERVGSEGIETDLVANVLSMLPLRQIAKLKSPSQQLCSAKRVAFKRLVAVKDIDVFPPWFRLRILETVLKLCSNITSFCYSRDPIQKCSITDAEAEMIAKIVDKSPRVRALRKIDFRILSKIKRSLDTIEVLTLRILDCSELRRLAKRCRRLKRAEIYLQPLGLADAPRNYSDAIKALLRANKGLTSFKIHNFTLGKELYTFLSDKTEELGLFSSGMDDEACRQLGRLKKLRKLVISGRDITFNGLKAIGENLTRLSHLDIAETDLGPSICAYLAMPSTLPKLKRLVVSPLKEDQFRMAIGEVTTPEDATSPSGCTVM